MDGYQFTAALVQSAVSLAWPVVAGLIAWSYKANILGVIQRMNGTVKGFGLEFSLDAAGQTAKAVEKEAAAAAAEAEKEVTEQIAKEAAPPVVEKDSSSNSPAPVHITVDEGGAARVRVGNSSERFRSPSSAAEPEEPLSEQPVSWTLEQVARIWPAEAFAETLSRIKDQLIELVALSNVNMNRAIPRASNLARGLAEAGVIDNKTAKLVEQVADIARQSRYEAPTPEQASRFLQIAESVQKSLHTTRVKLRLVRDFEAMSHGRTGGSETRASRSTKAPP